MGTESAPEGLELLAWGYQLIEGPTDDGSGGLFFSDVLGGGVFHLSSDGTTTTVLPKRRGIGGIALHADGGLVVSGRDMVHVRDGQTRQILAVDGVAGWNDFCTDRAGRIYGGTLRSSAFAEEHIPGECWRIDAEGDATCLYEQVGLANGVGLSPQEDRLFHADTRASAILVHELADGQVTRARPSIDTSSVGMPDGLALDEDGCVWAAMVGSGCIARWTPEGTLDQRLEIPADNVTSLCFGGPDRRTVFAVTADNRADAARAGSVFALQVKVAGLPVWPARL